MSFYLLFKENKVQCTVFIKQHFILNSHSAWMCVFFQTFVVYLKRLPPVAVEVHYTDISTPIKTKNQDSDLALLRPPLPITHSPSHLLSVPSPSLLLLTAALWVSVALCWHSVYNLADTCKAAQPDTLTNLHTHMHSIHTHVYSLDSSFFMLHKCWRAFSDCRASRSVGN